MAGAGADSALSGEGPLSLHLQRPPLFLPSVSLGKGPLRQPPAPPPKALRLEPWEAVQVLRGHFPEPPPQAGPAPPEPRKRSAPPRQHPRPGGDRDMQGHTGAADSAAPAAPLPQPGRAACPGLLAAVSHGASGRAAVALGVWPALRLGVAGWCGGQGWCRLLPGAPRGREGAGPLQAALAELRKPARKRVRPQPEMAGTASRLARLRALSREPRLGAELLCPWPSNLVTCHRTWGTDRPKG